MANPPNPGTFVWHEITTGNQEAARRFYTELLGWRSQTMDMGDAGQYTMFFNGDDQVGGIITLQQGPEWEGVAPHWRPYLLVADLEASLEQALALGARLLVPISPVPGMGRFAVLKDPAGAVIGLFEGSS